MLVILTNIPTPYRTPFFNTLQKELKKNNIGFHVLYCAETEPNRNWIFNKEEQKYEYTILKGLHLNFNSFYPHFNPSAISKIRLLKPKWLLVAGAWNTPTMIAASQKWLTGNMFRIFWNEGHSDAERINSGLIAIFRKIIFGQFDAFAVPNQKSSDYITKSLALNEPILFLPNSIDEDFYKSSGPNEKHSIRKHIGLPADKKIILQVSQLEDRKGVVELIESYLSLNSNLIESSLLVIVGEGALKEKLTTLINKSPNRKNIFLVGNQSKDQVRQWMIASDGFILCTKNDPNPLTPIEASFAGMPLLLSKKAGNFNELLIDNQNGIAIERIDKENICKVLSEFMNMGQKHIEKMGEASLANAMKRFQRERIAENFVDQLLSLRNSYK